MTLMENLCKVNNQQGGTIHQFLDKRNPDFERFERAYYDFTNIGIEFNNKKAFEKLIKNRGYNITINWD